MATINNDIRKVGPQKWADLQRENQLKQTGRVVGLEDYITDPEDLKRLKSYRPQSMTEFMLGQPVDERTQSDVYRKSGGEDRYGDSMWDPEEIGEVDIENIGNARGENQWRSAKWAAGLVKGANIAGTTLIDGTVGLAYGGVKGLLTGNVNALWDNEVSNAMTHWEEQMEKYAPNYRTDEELSNAWYQNLGTANFWADNVLKNMGFTVGAFYSGSIANKVIGKGLSFLRGNTAQKLIGTTVNSVNEGRKEANSFLKEARNEEYTKLEESYARAIQDINDKYAGMDSSLVPVKDVEGNIVGWEDPKYKAYDEEMANLKEQFERRKKEIDDNIASQGLQVMVGSTIVTSIADWYTISKLYGTSNKMTKDFIARGYTPEEAAKLTAKALEKEEASDLIFRNGRWAVDEVTKGKAIAKGLGVAVAEGPYEEMMQAVNSEYAKLKVRQDDPDAYYKALTDKNYQLQADKSIEQLGEAFSNVYLDPERWEEGFTGAIIGGLGVPKFGRSNDNSYTWFGKGKAFGMQGGLFGEISNAKEMNAEAEKRAKAMNDYLEKRDKQTRHFAQSMAFMEAADGYDPQTQKFEQKNAKDNADFAGLAAYADAGRLEDYKQLVSEDFANMSDEDLNTAGTVIRNKEEIAARTKLGEYDNEGILTEKGREVLRKELEEKKQKMLKATDIFERAYTRAYNQFSPYGLSQDDIMELAWLDWKRERFNDRGISLRDSKKDKLTALYNTIDKAAEAMQRMDASNLEDADMNEALINEIQERKASIKSRLSFLKMRQGKAKSDAYKAGKKPGDEGFEAWQAKLDEYRQREEETKKLEAEYDQLVEKEHKARQGTKDRLVARYKHYAELVNELINTEDPLSAISSILQLEKSLSRDINKGKMPLKYLDLLTKDDILTVDQNTGTAVLSKDIREMFEDLNLIKMAARQYTEKWIDYVTHPEKLQQNHEEIDRQNKAANEFSGSVEANEVARKTPMDRLRSLPEDKLNELEGKVTDPNSKEALLGARDTLRKMANFVEEVKKLNPGMANEFDVATRNLLRSKYSNASITDPSSEAWITTVNDMGSDEDPETTRKKAEVLRQAWENVYAKNASVLPTPPPQDTVGQDGAVQVPPANASSVGEAERRKKYNDAEKIRLISDNCAKDAIDQIGFVSKEESDIIYRTVYDFWAAVCPSIGNNYKTLSSGEIKTLVSKSEAYENIMKFGDRKNVSLEMSISFGITEYIDYLKTLDNLEASNEPTAVTITNPTSEDLEPKPEQQSQQLPKKEMQNYWRLATRRLPMSPIHGDMTSFPTIVRHLLAYNEDPSKAGEKAQYYYDNFNKLFPGRDFDQTMAYYNETLASGIKRIDRVEAIYNYLDKQGAFGFVDNLNVKAEDEVFFKVDPELNKDANDFVVLLAVKDTTGVEHIIGDLSVEDEAGSQNNLKEFIGRVKASYEKNKEEGKVYTYEHTTHIAQMLNGVVPYAYNEDGSHKLISLKEAFGNKEVVLTYAGKDDKVYKKGLPLLFLSSPKGSIRIPFISPVFNRETLEKNRDGALVTSVYRAVNALRSLPDLHGDKKKIAHLKGQLENILAFIPNSKGNTSIWIDYSEKNGERIVSISAIGADNKKETLTVEYANSEEFVQTIVEFLADRKLLFKIRNSVFNSKKEKDKAIAENFIELSKVNLQPGVAHTISNWFILNPLDANDSEFEATLLDASYVGHEKEQELSQEITLSNGKKGIATIDLSDRRTVTVTVDGEKTVLSNASSGTDLFNYRLYMAAFFKRYNNIENYPFYVDWLGLWCSKNDNGKIIFTNYDPITAPQPGTQTASAETKQQETKPAKTPQEEFPENKPEEPPLAEEPPVPAEETPIQQEGEPAVQKEEAPNNVQDTVQENNGEAAPASTEEVSFESHESLVEGLSDDLKNFYENIVKGTEWEGKVFEDVSQIDELEDRLKDVKANVKKGKLPDINIELFRKTGKSPYVPTDIKKEVAWLQKVLPQLSDSERLVIIDTLIRGKNAGELAWGMFYKGVMFIYNKASKGTTFHEAFHAVTHLILSPEEREKMFEEGATKYNLTDKVDIEEAIAEDFRRYVQLEEKPVVGFFIRLFRMLKNVLNVFSKHPSYINKLFYDIQSGSLADKKLDTYTSIDPTMYSSATPPEIQKEMEEIKAKAIADGTFMKAPNGNPTNLTEHQWLQVRTKAFKKWFGDWLNDPANASKVVDENGEPLVVYHGSEEKFTTFSSNTKNRGSLTSILQKGFYFSDKNIANQYASSKTRQDYYKLQELQEGGFSFEEIAEAFGANRYDDESMDRAAEYITSLENESLDFQDNLYAVFLNIKQPVEYDLKGGIISTLSTFQKETINNSEGAILRNVDETTSRYRGEITISGMYIGTDYIVFEPNQIKSATDNIGTFSLEDDDIRFRLVPDAQKWVKKYAEIMDGIKKANDEHDTHPEFFTRGYHTATEAWSIIRERKFLGGAKPEYNRGRWYIKPTTGDERASYKEYLKYQVENAILGRETFGSYAEYVAFQNAPSKQFPKKKRITSKQTKMLKQWQQDVERAETEIEEERRYRNLQARRLRKLMWGNLSEELKESLTNDGIDYVLWNKMSMDVRETYIKCHGL